MALTKDRVVDAAVGILRQFGLADLSMRRLARELDVQAGAIYWHVANKQALLVEVADRLLAAVTTSDDDDPEAGLRRLVTEVYDALLPVPDAADVVEIAYALDPDAIPALLAIRTLVGRLASSKAAPVAADLLVHYILGSVAAHQVRAHEKSLTKSLTKSPTTSTPIADGVDVVLRGIS